MRHVQRASFRPGTRRQLKILPNNIAILDEPDLLCGWVEEAGKLCHDPGVEKHYLPYINKGDVVIDAGAAIGDHTIAYMEKCGSPDLVHAFECNPKMIECLRHNCHGAHVYPFALADFIGMVNFHEESLNAGGGYVHKIHDMLAMQVPCVMLDNFHFPKVDFIKWDIEGYETYALYGGKETIERCKPKMVVEVNNPFLVRCGSDMQMLEHVLEYLGYSVECIMGNRDEGRYEALCLPK